MKFLAVTLSAVIKNGLDSTKILFFQIKELVKPVLLKKKSTQISGGAGMKRAREKKIRGHFLGFFFEFFLLWSLWP